MSKKVLCIDTGELFNTIGAAAKTVMGTGNNLWKAIKSGITYHNKKFVYVDETEATPETQHFGAAKERAVIASKASPKFPLMDITSAPWNNA